MAYPCFPEPLVVLSDNPQALSVSWVGIVMVRAFLNLSGGNSKKRNYFEISEEFTSLLRVLTLTFVGPKESIVRRAAIQDPLPASRGRGA